MTHFKKKIIETKHKFNNEFLSFLIISDRRECDSQGSYSFLNISIDLAFMDQPVQHLEKQFPLLINV